MNIKKYSNIFDFDIQDNIMIYTDPVENEDHQLNLLDYKNEYICDIHVNDRILAVIGDRLILYVKNEKIGITDFDFVENLFDLEIKVLNNSNLKINFKNKYIAEITIDGILLFQLDDFFAHSYYEKIITFNLFKIKDSSDIIFEDRQRYIGLANIKYNNIKMFITFDRFLNEIILMKIPFNITYINKHMYIELLNSNNMLIKNEQNDTNQIININKINTSPVPLTEVKQSKGIKNEHILVYLTFNKKRYYIYNQSNGIHILRSNPKLMTRYKSILKVTSGQKHFHIFGLFKHNGYGAKHKFDYLYIQNNNNRVGKFIRPFRKLKILNQLVYGKISYEDISSVNRIHSNLLCGNDEFIIHNISLNSFSKPMKTHKIKKYKNNAIIFRNNLGGNITLTSIPFSQEYSLVSKIKIFIAKLFAKKNSSKNVNLFFEKKSERAEESAIKVFDKVYEEDKKQQNKNYFILDKKAPYFNELKKKYGKNLIKKYSFKHFLSIYNSDYFVSSELSNHLINDRLYIDSLREKIMKTPSVFLQHGIMFAKPVDNPMAYGFHKNFNKYNNIKNVISSDLEAEQFYKMGYNSEDLIKTGLATFDNSTLDLNANKIAYMPTYRYWEEKLIYSGDITKTSYFQAIMKIIKIFEKNDMLADLLIVPHNKFSEFIYDNMPKYRHIIESNPSLALKKSKIFITDYSSAIYDAIYRGAYPIFYWEEKDYLIENYKAIPPVNEFNAPGPVAKNINELMSYVKNAIESNYELKEEYQTKYLNINEFNDNQNTKRIIEELKKIKIL
ncbi:CDP-glycerol glycerophosphotransferase family protein [Staphylococcus saprophyticus]|nr:CDP-glycerol glycerophosphotransferase family protein [Staphylococcus saprophyticus]MDW3925992.1 CDP-glycerol glycerophosphotransferase family protein [Staphylococcus saprophyticus]MDW3971130.1 CDP-glycerol glycerophosphotransferase family protein [Staphylococcus saprophyticus]MDW3976172.1 CDP-glycerol glycerophosphotransferase family protein [Staphylococcus saprophyticus]MDW3983776.1 CDP-glycerol glycerophosphotransferase family protein [Staphylococcus saprophyticus]